MKDLYKYLNEYGDYTFGELEFGEVDALLLCQLSYPKLGEIMQGDTCLTLQEIQEHPDAERLYTDRFFGKMYKEVIETAAKTRRFGRIIASHFREDVSEEDEMQFAAVTFELENGRHFVAFRGTDEKITGWKEDLNRGVMEVIPSQVRAQEYLSEVAHAKPEADFIVGGHSKGGAQAVYASVMAGDCVKDRIGSIYSFDGIGLGDRFYQSDRYARMADRISKFVPNKSLVGMLFEKSGNYSVVKSRGCSFKQHDFMNWRIDGTGFIYKGELDRAASRLADRVNSWIQSMKRSEAEFLIDFIDGLIRACNPVTIYDMCSRIPFNVCTIIRKLRETDKDRRQKVIELVRKLWNNSLPSNYKEMEF